MVFRSNLSSVTIGLLLAFAFAFAGVAASAAPKTVTATVDPTWTVMVYVCGDNNLELYALMDLDEMEAVGSKNGVKVVTLIDTETYIEGTHWYVVEEGSDHIDPVTYEHTCDCEEVTGEPCLPGVKSELDMGAGETLTDFIVQAVDYAPADKYMLILWDHGGGWRGVCYDDSHLADPVLGWVSRLTVPETADAIQAANDKIIGDEIDKDYRLTILGYDACLMGMIDVVYENMDIADYMFASITLVSVLGQDYEGILNAMTKTPRLTDEQIGIAVVDSFATFYEDYSAGAGIGGFGDQAMSFVRLGAPVQTLVDNVDALTRKIILDGYLDDSSFRGAIQSAESQTPKIPSSSGEQQPFIDLGLYAEKLGEKIPELFPYADAVFTSVKQVVVYEDHVTAAGGAIMRATGISAYFTHCWHWINPAYQFETLEEAELYGLNTLYWGLDFVVDTWWDEFVFLYTQPYDDGLVTLDE
jgi:hypothetical protein